MPHSQMPSTLLKTSLFILIVALFSCSDDETGTNNNDNNGSVLTNNSTPTNTSTQTTPTTGTTGGMTLPGGAPKLSNTPTFDLLAVKLFRFGWEEVSDATYYQMMENADGASDFVQVGENILPGVKTLDIEVPLCFRTNAQYLLKSCNEEGCTDSDPVSVSGNLAEAIGYFKAGNTDMGDRFGTAISLSADGKTMAIGAPKESSREVGDEDEDGWSESGAVYVFTQTDGKWIQHSFLKASNADRFDHFGSEISLSDDGQTLAVSAREEDSNASDNKGDNNRSNAGAIYVFEKKQSQWEEIHFIKLDNSQGTLFGGRMIMSGDGNTIVASEKNPFLNADTISIFTKIGESWIKEKGFSRANAVLDNFGFSLTINTEGSIIGVGANREDSNASGINGDQDNDLLSNSGAVFIYEKKNGIWEETYIKPDIQTQGAGFGSAISISADGSTLAVVGGGKENEGDNYDGKPYVYIYKKGAVWALTKKLLPGKSGGYLSVSLNTKGTLLAIGAITDQNSSEGLNGTRSDVANTAYGAVLVFGLDNDVWSEEVYVKASVPGERDNFGTQVEIADDGTLVVGVPLESSSAKGVDGDQMNEDAAAAGAVYLY